MLHLNDTSVIPSSAKGTFQKKGQKEVRARGWEEYCEMLSSAYDMVMAHTNEHTAMAHMNSLPLGLSTQDLHKIGPDDILSHVWGSGLMFSVNSC